mmetsp:Transcript_74858/g.214443  ORF Transcript_74858/g.214443 Transcript_74858/m.214443 type:complete len:223 (-) Transcript_74858:327-995(-)
MEAPASRDPSSRCLMLRNASSRFSRSAWPAQSVRARHSASSSKDVPTAPRTCASRSVICAAWPSLAPCNSRACCACSSCRASREAARSWAASRRIRSRSACSSAGRSELSSVSRRHRAVSSWAPLSSWMRSEASLESTSRCCTDSPSRWSTTAWSSPFCLADSMSSWDCLASCSRLSSLAASTAVPEFRSARPAPAAPNRSSCAARRSKASRSRPPETTKSL